MLTDIELVEISCVQSAVAYPGTTIAARWKRPPARRRRRALAGL
jgi:hypothetical protein